MRRYQLGDATAGEALKLLGDSRIMFEPSGLAGPITYRFAVDESSGAIALLEIGGLLSAQPFVQPIVLHWLAGAATDSGLQSSELRELGSHRSELPSAVLDVAFQRDRVAIVGGSLRVFQRVNGEIELLAARDARNPASGSVEFEPRALLGFDGKELYLFEMDEHYSGGLSVYESATLERRARYQTASIPSSVTVVGDHLLIGGDATLTVAAPACSLPTP